MILQKIKTLENQIINIKLTTNYTKSITAKNTAGSITNYQSVANATFVIEREQKSEKFYELGNKEIMSSLRYNSFEYQTDIVNIMDSYSKNFLDKKQIIDTTINIDEVADCRKKIPSMRDFRL